MRRCLTVREKLALLERQQYRCAICEEEFGFGRVEFDHQIPLAIRDGKATQAVHATCHRFKTKSDRKTIAKAYRLHRTFVLGEKRPGRKINSRGFDRAWSRKLDGTTVRRMA